jgi:hypothetical protein
MTKRSPSMTRTLLGLVLALPLAALIAGLFACLPVPVGDPEKSKVDPKFVGGWVVSNNEKNSTLYIIRAFDERTYLVQVLGFEVQADKSIKPASNMSLKAWLTPIGKETYVCAELLNPETPMGIAGDKDKPAYFVATVSLKNDELTLRVTNPDSPQLKDVKTREDAEKALAAHADEADVLGKPVVLKKLGKDDAENTRVILKAFNLGDAK